MTDAYEKDAHGDVTHPVSRRMWLRSACATAVALAIGGLTGGLGGVPRWRAALTSGSLFGVSDAFAQTPPASAAGAGAAPANGGIDAFLALSQRLTGRTGFDATLGRRVFDALSHSDSQLPQHVAALNAWLQTHGGVPSDAVTPALQTEQPALAGSVGAIMRAWYLGLVGDSPHVQVVAYERALMFDPVKDVLTVPSYCRDVPFYWTQKPPGAAA
ncbi:sugar dehydrogenase complex small subunit [Paraburkholderia sp.]|uniref:sugar dehydrogenase complex small subunit n=1 Tax=Paraburkholderia sp. TaxID=1926495 RepID=UPI00238FF2AE|nr:sugar dehydrogenase complex small subunit [Paraburkholderia sp.]MDE1182080.1 sugar dehydrogenase complex small subunit [Paraburkholderia sp.]